MLSIDHQKPASFYSTFERKDGDPHVTHYCPGCGHGVLHKFIAEAIDDLGIQDRTILVSPVGCSVFAYYYMDVGNVQAAHGRAPAVATGIKRSRPESIVISYQGDGDLAAIGTAEIIHAANRGENITVFFVNNAIYGMTGGQMAPTTLLGQKTSTTPSGRNAENDGFPLRVCELLSSLEGPVYLERVALTGPKNHMKARRAVRKAISNQIENRGFSLVEILSPCPTGWKMTPEHSWEWIEQQMMPVFPLGVYKDTTSSKSKSFAVSQPFPNSSIAAALDLDSGDSSPAEADLSHLAERKHIWFPNAAMAPTTKAIKIAGFGGQGILSLGVVLAIAGMKDGLHASWLPSYGPEMRGGTAHCDVILSGGEIGSPLIDQPDVLIAMNAPSLLRFQNRVRSGGLVIYDSSLITESPEGLDTDCLGVPASQMASELGEPKVANLIILGALIEKVPFLTQVAIHHAIDEIINNERLRRLNREALELGRNYRTG
jgi:2-oxoisovalerate ferredoxin oxidoreductase beta subunit